MLRLKIYFKFSITEKRKRDPAEIGGERGESCRNGGRVSVVATGSGNKDQEVKKGKRMIM